MIVETIPVNRLRRLDNRFLLVSYADNRKTMLGSLLTVSRECVLALSRKCASFIADLAALAG